MKQRVAVMFGGKSPEHWVSLKSGLFIASLLHDSEFEVLPIYIDQSGNLAPYPQLASAVEGFLQHSNVPLYEASDKVSSDWVASLLDRAYRTQQPGAGLLDFLASRASDLLFPVFHGRYGEDGTVQGLAEFFDYPYVGCNLCGSSLGIDKALTKHAVRSQGLRVAHGMELRHEFWLYNRQAWQQYILKRMRLPLFVKPVRLGSSIGIHKVKTPEQLDQAIEAAFAWDHRLLIEEQVEGIEYSIGVLGLEGDYQVSSVSESTLRPDYFDYDAKYGNSAPDDIVPAQLEPEKAAEYQAFAVSCFQALGMEGWCRIDLFGSPMGPVLNEVNTMPGLSAHAPFVKAWEHSGKSKRQLILDAIELGFALANKLKHYE